MDYHDSIYLSSCDVWIWLNYSCAIFFFVNSIVFYQEKWKIVETVELQELLVGVYTLFLAALLFWFMPLTLYSPPYSWDCLWTCMSRQTVTGMATAFSGIFQLTRYWMIRTMNGLIYVEVQLVLLACSYWWNLFWFVWDLQALPQAEGMISRTYRSNAVLHNPLKCNIIFLPYTHTGPRARNTLRSWSCSFVLWHLRYSVSSCRT